MNEIFSRHSIRKYLDKPIESEKIQLLLRAAMQAPSGGNQQPWEFIVVTEKTMLESLSKTSSYSSPASRAPLCIVVLGNSDYMRFPELWTHDLGACCQNILLEAVHLELGAVWMSIEPTEDRILHIKTLFNLPDQIKPFALIAIGYSAEKNNYCDRFLSERIHYNAFP